MVKRKLVQICTALLYNGNFAGFTDGNIWKGSSKNICLPGLNCYSCPGALGACPLGSLQSSLSGVFLRIPFYVLGFILLFALIFARLICGWGCPFGLVQELLYKIPTPKLQRNRFTYLLSYLKYFIALIFLIILPLAFYQFTGSGVPAFCKFICPAGTLEAVLCPWHFSSHRFVSFWASCLSGSWHCCVLPYWQPSSSIAPSAASSAL